MSVLRTCKRCRSQFKAVRGIGRTLCFTCHPPRVGAITPRQRDCLVAIQRYLDEHGYPPTARNLMVLLNVGSTNCVADFLAGLEAKGFIRVDRYVARGIRVLKDESGNPCD